MEKQKSGIAGKIIAGIFLAIVLAFMGLLVYIKLIPTFILGIIGVILLFLVLTVGILTWNSRKKVSFVIGIILALVFTAIFAFGGLYIYKTTSTLAQIAGANTEITQVGIYVRPDDSAVSVLDTAEYTYGIMTDLDRENTDKALEEVKQEVGTEVAVQEYRGLSELLNGLVSGEAGAIILNQAYLPIMEEMQGVPDMSSIMREINVKNVETVIDTKEDAVQPGEGEEGENAGSAAAKNGEVYTVFISGIDNRGGIVAKSRSDVNIIAVANTATRQLLLVSTPRDYFVPLSISGGVPDKLTHAGIYGISVCMNTLGMLYDTDINYYFRLNFAGFENIIDALGGINVYSDYDFDSQNILGYHYNQGENFVNGEQALVFARERYAFKEGDRQREKTRWRLSRVW